jgi:hypothetical protein
MMLAQVINVARCYPPQPKEGEYPGRDFIEVPKELTSTAPSPPRASKKRKQIADANVVKDSEDVGDTHFSSGDDDDSMIPAKPLDSRPPPRFGKKVLPKFGLDASYVFLQNFRSNNFVFE